MRLSRLAGTVLVALFSVSVGAAPAAADDRLQWVRFQNVSSFKCLDALPGQPAVQVDCPWSVRLLEEGTNDPNLVILSVAGSCLQVEGASLANYARIVMGGCAGGWHTVWRQVPSGFSGTSTLARWLAGSILLQNAYSGKCVEVYANSQSNGAAMVQNDCTRAFNQLWFTEKTPY